MIKKERAYRTIKRIVEISLRSSITKEDMDELIKLAYPWEEREGYNYNLWSREKNRVLREFGVKECVKSEDPEESLF